MVTASVRLTGLSWPSLHQLNHALRGVGPEQVQKHLGAGVAGGVDTRGATSLPRAPQHPAHSPLYGAGTRSVQRLLAGLGGKLALNRNEAGGASDRYVMEGLTVGRYLLAALGHAIVSNYKSDEQAIVAEDALAAGRLRRAMALMAAPASDRLVVTPERQGQQLIGVRLWNRSTEMNPSIRSSSPLRRAACSK
jgi:hypothetical protein